MALLFPGRLFGNSFLVTAAILLVVVFVLVGIFAPLLAPMDPNVQMLTARLKPPLTQGHLLGTDTLGRDVLSRLIYGARVSLWIGFVVVALTAVVGVLIGLISGYFGGWIDSIIMRLADIWLAFPFLV